MASHMYQNRHTVLIRSLSVPSFLSPFMLLSFKIQRIVCSDHQSICWNPAANDVEDFVAEIAVVLPSHLGFREAL